MKICSFYCCMSAFYDLKLHMSTLIDRAFETDVVKVCKFDYAYKRFKKSLTRLQWYKWIEDVNIKMPITRSSMVIPYLRLPLCPPSLVPQFLHPLHRSKKLPLPYPRIPNGCTLYLPYHCVMTPNIVFWLQNLSVNSIFGKCKRQSHFILSNKSCLDF